jgi:hypothetical protein
VTNRARRPWVGGPFHPTRFAATAKAKLPVWCVAGGRDPAVPPQFFYAAMNELDRVGGVEYRFTIEADLGHLAWVRIYGGQDLYDWLLAHSR